MSMQEFYGEIAQCDMCRNGNQKPIPDNCRNCLSRGFVAKCLNCGGKGQKEQPMAGGPGSMKSTCHVCGGRGIIPVRKPENWQYAPEAGQEVAQPATL